MKVGYYMEKNEFDMDFDFEKEFGLSLDDLGADLELDFTDEDSTDVKIEPQDDFDFEMDDLNPESFLPDSEETAEDIGLDSLLKDFDLGNVSSEEAPAEESDAPVADPFLGGMDDVDFLMGTSSLDDEDLFESEDGEEDGKTSAPGDFDYQLPTWDGVPGSLSDEIRAPGLSAEDDAPEYEETEEKSRKRKRAFKLPSLKKTRKPGSEQGQPKPKREANPIFAKIFDLYFGPLTHRGQEPEEPENGRRRRRRKTKMDVFKEVYLPPLIALVALIVILFFIVGSVTNAFKQKAINDERNRRESVAASLAAEEAQANYESAMAQAEQLAANYDFSKAIELVDSLLANDTIHAEALIAKKAEYVKAQSNLVEWKDISQIPNLSFHVLIADPARAFADKELGGLYNRNFVTVEEFERVLKELYANDYILVDFDTIVQSNVGLDGKKSFFTGGLYLPQGKSPVMITETMVNYFEYMIDSNKDGSPDANGAGFASKLVIDSNGDIKAQMVDASGNTVVGNYDLVPVLESFIAEHPDFSFKGSRATLAVSGTEGIFGYRTNTSYITSRGQAYYEQEVAEARVLVDALKAKGYNIACYTYGNVNYKTMTVAQIQADQQNWASQIVPVMGETEILVYAREGDIDDYTGNKFTQLFNTGYHYFVTNGENPSTDVKENFVRQSRLMVTGNAMGWYSSRFAKYFDANKVLDMTSRKSIPN